MMFVGVLRRSNCWDNELIKGVDSSAYERNLNYNFKYSQRVSALECAFYRPCRSITMHIG